MKIKRFRFKHVLNFRDMGGVYGSDDKIVRWNTLYRSDKLIGAGSEDWKTMEKAGIKTILDLRSDEEVQMFPDGCPENFRYIHFPLVEENLSFNNISSPAMQAFAKGVAEGYKNIVLSHGENLAKAVNMISDYVKDGGVVFHCTSGKDRTGVVASVLYYILGVSAEDIAADYQTSYTYNKKTSDKFMNEHPQYQKYRSVVMSDVENIYELLKLYEEIDIENYLLSKGADKEKIENLRKICLTDING